jgi:hypothetical protein
MPMFIVVTFFLFLQFYIVMCIRHIRQVLTNTAQQYIFCYINTSKHSTFTFNDFDGIACRYVGLLLINLVFNYDVLNNPHILNLSLNMTHVHSFDRSELCSTCLVASSGSDLSYAISMKTE